MGDTSERQATPTAAMDAMGKKVYPVETLITLQRTLPELKCDLKSFTADAWRGKLNLVSLRSREPLVD